jgi:HEAT repeat protein
VPTPEGRRGQGRPQITFDSWLFWWAYNGDAILDLRARLRAGRDRVRSFSNPVGIGRSHGRSEDGARSVTDVAIAQRVVPALEAALDPSLHFDIRAGAVLALAKVGATQEKAVTRRIGQELLAILANESGDEHVTVEESSALALGLLQCDDVEIVDALRDVMLDRRARTRTRAFAALALGLLGLEPGHDRHDAVAKALRDVVGSEDETHVDVPACALLAMGLSGDRAYVTDLLAMVRDGTAGRGRKLPDILRAYAASALGRVLEASQDPADEAAVETLQRALTRSGAHTPRSAVIALGQIAVHPRTPDDVRRRLVRVLGYTVTKGEAMAANFACIALGRIGASTDDPALRGGIAEMLDRESRKGAFVTRPFAALGLGLLGRRPGDVEVLGERLLKEFVQYRGDPRGRGAYAIALGMLGDRRAVPALRSVLEDRSAYKRLRGFCAVALGMIHDRTANPAIRAALLEEPDPELRVDAAIAAGLAGESEVVDDLIGILRDPRSSLYVQGSVVLSLGRIGDERAVEPLIEILADGEAQDLKRALAACALGLLGDRQDHPVLARIGRDVNYRAQVDAVMEVLSFL